MDHVGQDLEYEGWSPLQLTHFSLAYNQRCHDQPCATSARWLASACGLRMPKVLTLKATQRDLEYMVVQTM
ncbi:hypothetical protein TNCV_3380861 [Trichonephila clavipes]|nr:hypothetical protein TNCV_3380861 [Trichonephila clavipes]